MNYTNKTKNKKMNKNNATFEVLALNQVVHNLLHRNVLTHSQFNNY